METLEPRVLLAGVTLIPAKDNTLFEDSAGALSSGSGEFLFAGVQGRGYIRRAAVAFDLVAAGIPAGSKIEEVALELSVVSANSADDHDFAVYKLTQDWGEGLSNSPGGTGAEATVGDATWLDTFHGTESWTNPGGDFNAAPSAAASVSGSHTTARWSSTEMAADVAAWLADPATNFGWIVRSDETSRNVRKFASRENLDGAPPKLFVNYSGAESLSVTLSAPSVSEGQGARATTATVRRNTDIGDALVVNLTSSDATEATVPPIVTIPAGQTTSPAFAVDAVDDTAVDRTQTVTITAAARGHSDGSRSLQVTDNDTTLVRVENRVLHIKDRSDGGANDRRSLAIDGSELVIQNPGNAIVADIAAATRGGSSEVRLPLTSFPAGLVVDTARGDDSLTLDGSLDSALLANMAVDGGAGNDTLYVAGAGVELRLSQFTDVDRIDLTGTGDNTLIVDLASARANVDDAADPLVIAADQGDTLTFDGGWTIAQTFVADQRLFRVVRHRGVDLHVSGPLDWQNPVLPLDVSGDGIVSPRDALLIVNEMNQPRYTTTGVLMNAVSLDEFPLSFFDVVGDGIVAPGDAIQIIDFLNDNPYAGLERPSQSTPVRVSVVRDDNLQWMNFWVAAGAGYFAAEGIDVEVVAGQVGRAVVDGLADVAVMPRPTWLSEVAQERPVVSFANLLANDPINLVVHRQVAEQRGLSMDMPLAERLQKMQGLRIGVAPGPPSRLEFLFDSVGLDASQHIEMVILSGPEQNPAFAAGMVDALYAHTPFLETALVEQNGVLLVNQSAGEVPGLADRQIHLMVTSRDYAAENQEVVAGITRAVYRAQQLIHKDPQGTLDAIRASGVELQAAEGLETIVRIYAPAIPQTPFVSADGALRELAFFPNSRPAPDLTGIDISAFVDNRFAEAAVAKIDGKQESD